MLSSVGEGSVCGCQFKRRYTFGHPTKSQGCRVVVVGTAFFHYGSNTEILKLVYDFVFLQLLEYPDGVYVNGLFNGLAHGNVTLVTVVGVLRPDPSVNREWCIVNNAGGRPEASVAGYVVILVVFLKVLGLAGFGGLLP